jgi:hypothetical protein
MDLNFEAFFLDASFQIIRMGFDHKMRSDSSLHRGFDFLIEIKMVSFQYKNMDEIDCLFYISFDLFQKQDRSNNLDSY